MGTGKPEMFFQFRKAWPLTLLTGAACFLTLIYCLRPNAFAIVTFLPAWGWLLLLVPMIPFLRWKYRFPALLCVLAWLVFALLYIEEPKTLLRGLLSPVKLTKSPDALRLISVNCAAGTPGVLQEIKSWKPDIVFLQESPPRKDVESLARDLFGAQGAFLYDIDSSIVVRGNLESLHPQQGTSFFSLGTSTLPGIGEVILVSLRLYPGIASFELWDPDCWKRQADQHLAQLQQMEQLAARLDTTKPIIVAGDFNAPPGDKIFKLLPYKLYDSFRAQGR
ncbi:MAG: endonuclease/exonuclease/phosphatase family protein, partial [Kiritimatiellia bacterium]